MKEDLWENFGMPAMRRAAALRTDWSLDALVEETYVDRIAIINPGADQSMHQDRDGMQREWLADETELS